MMNICHNTSTHLHFLASHIVCDTIEVMARCSTASNYNCTKHQIFYSRIFLSPHLYKSNSLYILFISFRSFLLYMRRVHVPFHSFLCLVPKHTAIFPHHNMYTPCQVESCSPFDTCKFHTYHLQSNLRICYCL